MYGSGFTVVTTWVAADRRRGFAPPVNKTKAMSAS